MDDSEQNRSTATQNAEFYEQLWSELNRKLLINEFIRVRFVVDSIRELIGHSGLRILDHGCGRGWMAPYLSPFGTVTGIDFSPGGIRFAQENYGGHARFLLADPDSPALGLPADSLFDIVVSSEVVEHVPEHKPFLRQIAGLLRPGGYCLLTTPNGLVWPQFRTNDRLISWALRRPSHLQPIEHWATPAQLSELFRQVNFRVVRHEGRIFYGFGMPPFRWLGRLEWRLVEGVFKKIGMHRRYARRMLPMSMYQVIVGQKIS